MAGVRVRFGRPEGMREVEAALGAQLTRAMAETVIERVKSRVKHPAADSLVAVGVNQHAADIRGTRGGPGIIRPVRAKALRFVSRSGQVVFAKEVNGAGLLPLIVAEGERVSQTDVTSIVQKIDLP